MMTRFFYAFFAKEKPAYVMYAGFFKIAPAGFEPAHGGTKNRCLTAWPRGNS